MNAISFPADSKIWGPGVWFVIHVLALHAITIEKIRQYISEITLIIENLPCHDCRNHAIGYLKSNPLESYIQMKDEKGRYNGMFKWSWTFHNAVNMRLGKQIINYETALDIYENQEVCTETCSQ